MKKKKKRCQFSEFAKDVTKSSVCGPDHVKTGPNFKHSWTLGSAEWIQIRILVVRGIYLLCK